MSSTKHGIIEFHSSQSVRLALQNVSVNVRVRTARLNIDVSEWHLYILFSIRVPCVSYTQHQIVFQFFNESLIDFTLLLLTACVVREVRTERVCVWVGVGGWGVYTYI